MFGRVDCMKIISVGTGIYSGTGANFFCVNSAHSQQRLEKWEAFTSRTLFFRYRSLVRRTSDMCGRPIP